MGTSIRLPAYSWGFELLSVGQSNFPRELAVSATTLGSGALRLGYFTARKSETVATIAFGTTTTAAGATPTLVRYGLYSVASDGNLTLIGSTPNDTTIFASITTLYPRALSVPVAITQGVRYAVGALVVTGATAPAVQAGQIGGAVAISALAPRLAAALASQTDLPASITAGSLIDVTFRPWALLTP